MKTFAYLFLIGVLSFADAKKFDDFSEIPIIESSQSSNKTGEAKTLDLNLYQNKTYKDHVKDELFKHATVKANKLTAKVDKSADGTHDFKVDTDRNLSYYTYLFVGSAKAKVKVAFDTMSTISLINSSNCQGCSKVNGEGFEYQKSYTIRKVNDSKAQVKIEGESAKGVLVHDNVRLQPEDKKAFIKEFPFLLVNYWTQSVFENVDGVIGLSKSFFDVNGNNSGPSLLNALYQQDIISKKMFAVHFDNFGGSQIKFGGYDSEKMVPNIPTVYLDAPYEKTWKMTINAFRVGNKPTFANGAKSAYFTEQKDAYLDTFSPYIKIPSSISTQVFSTFFHDQPDIRTDEDTGLLFGPCDMNLYQEISLFINDRYYVKMVPESFVIDIGKVDRCFIPFTYNSEDHWVIGEPFFRNFYTVFDDSKGLIGITPSINYVHASITEGIVPNDELHVPGMHKEKKKTERKEKLPSLNDPLSVVKYTIGKGVDTLTGGAGLSSTAIYEIVGGLVMLILCGCCSVGGIIYLGFQAINFMRPKQIPDARPLPDNSALPAKKAAGPMFGKFKKSKKTKMPQDHDSDEEGVLMTKIMSKKEIQDQIDHLKSVKASVDSDSDQELNFAGSSKIGIVNQFQY